MWHEMIIVTVNENLFIVVLCVKTNLKNQLSILTGGSVGLGAGQQLGRLHGITEGAAAAAVLHHRPPARLGAHQRARPHVALPAARRRRPGAEARVLRRRGQPLRLVRPTSPQRPGLSAGQDQNEQQHEYHFDIVKSSWNFINLTRGSPQSSRSWFCKVQCDTISF